MVDPPIAPAFTVTDATGFVAITAALIVTRPLGCAGFGLAVAPVMLIAAGASPISNVFTEFAANTALNVFPASGRFVLST